MVKATSKANVPAKAGKPAASVPAKQSDQSREMAAFDTGDTGFENVGARDLLIPRLSILQGLSPQVTKGKPEYDEEAKSGEIYDIGLQQRFPKGIVFLPVFYKMAWLEWAPRASNKGLQKIHDTDAILADTEMDEKTGLNFLPNGNYIVDTAQLYGLNMSAEFRRSFVPMKGTQLKKVRRLLTLSTAEKVKRADGSAFTPPLWYRTYAFDTVPESNAEGNWQGWKIERGAPLTDWENWEELLADVKEFRKSLMSGTIAGDVSTMEDGGGRGGKPAADESAAM